MNTKFYLTLSLIVLLMPFTSLQATQHENEPQFADWLTADMRKMWLSSFSEPNKTSYKPRIINTTDLGADPDDEQSMVRQLVCSNEFDIQVH